MSEKAMRDATLSIAVPASSSRYAKSAHNMLMENQNQSAQARRHAIGYAVVYALLDLADAIRQRGGAARY